MSNTVNYLEANGVCAIILLMILFNESRIQDRVDYRVIYSQYILFSIFYLIIDSIWILIDRNVIPNTRASVDVINFLYMIIMELTSYLWLLYSYAFTKSQHLRSRKSRQKAALPIVGVCVLMLVLRLMGGRVYLNGQYPMPEGRGLG